MTSQVSVKTGEPILYHLQTPVYFLPVSGDFIHCHQTQQFRFINGEFRQISERFKRRYDQRLQQSRHVRPRVVGFLAFYTVGHKTCHFILHHNSPTSWWIFILFVPLKTG